ncbi:sigma-E factor negative regulatory protein [Variovorax sp. LARHSF232]
MNDSDKLREQVSALLDGQLRGEDFARTVEQVCGQDELRGTWNTYHVVGEVLRSGRHTVCRDSSAFLAGLRERLASEGVKPAVAAAPAVEAAPQAEAANEPIFRWKLVAGVASLALAAAVGWNWVGGPLQAPAGAQLAQGVQGAGNVPVLASSIQPAGESPTTTTRVLIGERQQPQLMLRDPRLDALLEAHQQAGGGSHMPSGFLRNATFEGQSR